MAHNLTMAISHATSGNWPHGIPLRRYHSTGPTFRCTERPEIAA